MRINWKTLINGLFILGAIVFAVWMVVPWGELRIDEHPTGIATKEDEEDLIDHWTCGMHPSVRSDKPGQCPICRMELIPVYKERQAAESQVELGDLEDVLTLDPRARRLAEVSSEEVQYRPLYRWIDTVGILEYNEQEVKRATAWVGGRIDRLHVDFTGRTVKRGEPVAEIYSPQLITAQQEYLLALRTHRRTGSPQIDTSLKRMREEEIDSERPVQPMTWPILAGPTKEKSWSSSLLDVTRARLLLWGITEKQIAELERTGEVRTHMTIHAPMGGTVIRKFVQEGEYVKEGNVIVEIADLSTLWLMLDVYQQDLVWMDLGQWVRIVSPSIPSMHFTGTVDFIDPFITGTTRSVKARVTVQNEGNMLLPGMYVRTQVEIPLRSLPSGPSFQRDEKGWPLALPKSAVIDTGERFVIFVDHGGGRFERRTVRVGGKAMANVDEEQQSFHPVVDGVQAGEQVVTRAAFLIDSQTELGAAAGAYGGALEAEEGTKPAHQH